MMRGVFVLTAVLLAGTGLGAEAGERKGMVRIPAGVNGGRDPDFGEYSLAVEEPFHMDATEVTWGFWREVRDWAVTNGYEDLEEVGAGKADDHPVQSVNWFAAVKWCNARSEKEGLVPCYNVGGVVCRRSGGAPDCSFAASGYRLPTHTEWEYAARGGLVSKRYPWGDTIAHGQANYYSHAGDTNDVSKTRGPHPAYGVGAAPFTAPVASFAPNGFGLYDMAGNVWEWCWAPKGASRTFRGGSWDGDAGGVRCGYRSENSGNGEQSVYGGFRCVRRAGQ
jgi:formylglycine-generating enzyme required for sulfatase activity